MVGTQEAAAGHERGEWGERNLYFRELGVGRTIPTLHKKGVNPAQGGEWERKKQKAALD